MKILVLLFCCLLPNAFAPRAFATSVTAPPDAVIAATLDAWHAAASRANEAEYFAFFTPDAVFLGTDPTERWTRDELQKWAHPLFSKGKGWTLRAVHRFITLSRDGKTAWFDEDVDSKELGPSRGSGVLVEDEGKWKVAQYNLSIPIPNERFDAVRKLITDKPAVPAKPLKPSKSR